MYSRPAVGSEYIRPAGSAGCSMLCCSLPCGRRERRELRHNWNNFNKVAGFILWVIHTPHDDVIKWKHFPRYWPFVRGIHRWPMNSLHKGQWRGALMYSLSCAWINAWVNNCEGWWFETPSPSLWRHCLIDIFSMHHRCLSDLRGAKIHILVRLLMSRS